MPIIFLIFIFCCPSLAWAFGPEHDNPAAGGFPTFEARIFFAEEKNVLATCLRGEEENLPPLNSEIDLSASGYSAQKSRLSFLFPHGTQQLDDRRAVKSFNRENGNSFSSEERLSPKYKWVHANGDKPTDRHGGNEGASLDRRDWKGVARDTGFFLLYQPVVIGVFYLLPEKVIGYTQDQKKISFNKWLHNEQHPHFDRDAFWINFIAHPLWGSSFYIRARERGFDRFESFWYSALLSAIFEFGTESVYEPPSYNDLIATPVIGTVIGAFIFEPIRDHVKSKPRLAWYDHAVLIATDPLGAANKLMERLFGIESTIRVRYWPSGEPRHASSSAEGSGTLFSQGQTFRLEYIAQW